MNHERESAGVSRRAGDTTSRWKDVQGVESYCVGRFFSVKKSCSGERAFQPCVAKTEKFNLLEEIQAERSFCDICNHSRCWASLMLVLSVVRAYAPAALGEKC